MRLWEATVSFDICLNYPKENEDAKKQRQRTEPLFAKHGSRLVNMVHVANLHAMGA